MSASKSLEIRVDDKIVFLNEVESLELSVQADGTVALLAQQAGLDAVQVSDNPLIPPPSSGGAPDGDDDDEQPSTDPAVIEQVHTGDRDPEAEEREAKARRAAARKAKTEADRPKPADGDANGAGQVDPTAPADGVDQGPGEVGTRPDDADPGEQVPPSEGDTPADGPATS